LGRTLSVAAKRLLPPMLALPRGAKRAVMVSIDCIMIPLAFLSAVALKHGSFLAIGDYSLWLLVVAGLSSVMLFAVLGLYRAVLRFMAPTAAIAVAVGVSGSALIVAAADRLSGVPDVPWSAIVIYWTLATLYVGGTRMIGRHSILRLQGNGSRERVAIYGAGEAGSRLAAALFLEKSFLPVAFIDDNRALTGNFIGSVEVFSPSNLPGLIQSRGIKRVLLAIPSSTARRRRDILAALEPCAVRVQTVPDFVSIVTGEARVDDLRDIDPADLLARELVPPNGALLDACIEGKSVMVTGAGGSIGAELCRQIVRLAPKRLILFEMSELALYTIEREMRQVGEHAQLPVEIVPLLGSAHHRGRVREVMQTYGVQTVYHAAAYKHVPIVEQNVIEGVHNNVIATWHTAEAAVEARVETFVLISTDKAVNPTNVMGATKRLAELVLQGIQARGGATRFCMVRFGNVLSSSGSVVPLFEQQIRDGGPITVTHPEARRYFMTIPEAAQLVIQAGSMAEGGDVFVLDMGRPVKIVDLAQRLIHLHGLSVRDEANPEGDIEILHTGLRPAEKLYEELLIGTNVTGTEHPMIQRAVEHLLPWEAVQGFIEQLLLASKQFDCRKAINVLIESVQEYRPAEEVSDLVWAAKQPARVALVEEASVTELASRRRQN